MNKSIGIGGFDDPKYREVYTDIQKRHIDSQIWTSCVNCDWWSPTEEVCEWADMAAKVPEPLRQRPPAPIIVIGCSRWVGMIPF